MPTQFIFISVKLQNNSVFFLHVNILSPCFAVLYPFLQLFLADFTPTLCSHYLKGKSTWQWSKPTIHTFPHTIVHSVISNLLLPVTVWIVSAYPPSIHKVQNPFSLLLSTFMVSGTNTQIFWKVWMKIFISHSQFQKDIIYVKCVTFTPMKRYIVVYEKK